MVTKSAQNNAAIVTSGKPKVTVSAPLAAPAKTASVRVVCPAFGCEDGKYVLGETAGRAYECGYCRSQGGDGMVEQSYRDTHVYVMSARQQQHPTAAAHIAWLKAEGIPFRLSSATIPVKGKPSNNRKAPRK